VERQVVSIWAGTTGKLDSVPVPDIRRFEAEFLDYVGRQHKGIFDAIASTKDLGDDLVAQLDAAVTAFKLEFAASSGAVADHAAESLDSDEVGQETIIRHVPAAKK
jgi:F-type H+-transporting ATPase subunit alpha